MRLKNNPKRFRAKWIPVRVKKVRQKQEAFSSHAGDLAISQNEHDISLMKCRSLLIVATMLACVAGAASAQQMTPPGWSQFNPPLPASPPPPRIEAPVIPKLNAPVAQPRARASRRDSFGDRISRCLDEGAAAGLDPGARAAYSRSCANR
jgi:hypothetical protein